MPPYKQCTDDVLATTRDKTRSTGETQEAAGFSYLSHAVELVHVRLLTESDVKLYYSRLHVLFGTGQNEEQPSDVSVTVNSVRDVKYWVRATSAMRGFIPACENG